RRAPRHRATDDQPQPSLLHFTDPRAASLRGMWTAPQCGLRESGDALRRRRSQETSHSRRPSQEMPPQNSQETTEMATMDHERWSRVKGRLRAEVGDDIFSSWFTRMELDGIEDGTARLSVPTRFLKSWIQNHYAERVLACWQAEDNDVRRVDRAVRPAVIRTNTAPPKPVEPAEPASGLREEANGFSHAKPVVAPIATAHEALGGSPLDPRLTFDSFV